MSVKLTVKIVQNSTVEGVALLTEVFANEPELSWIDNDLISWTGEQENGDVVRIAVNSNGILWWKTVDDENQADPA